MHVFVGKLRQKASWTRGVFISWMGYSDDGLQTFDRGHSVICISGADLYYSLSNRILFPVLLNAKVRDASEADRHYVSYQDLPDFRGMKRKTKR